MPNAQPNAKPHTKKTAHQVSMEELAHFRCGSCGRWWTIGDVPAKKDGKKEWHCPWCGVRAPARTIKK